MKCLKLSVLIIYLKNSLNVKCDSILYLNILLGSHSKKKAIKSQAIHISESIQIHASVCLPDISSFPCHPPMILCLIYSVFMGKNDLVIW